MPIGRREVGVGFFGPFDEAEVFRLKILFESAPPELLRIGETVAVEMINWNREFWVGFDEGVGGAFDRAAVA